MFHFFYECAANSHVPPLSAKQIISKLFFLHFNKNNFYFSIILGLTSQTTAENITQSAYEATGFQIYEILESFRKDTLTWNSKDPTKKLVFGGDFTEDSNLMQYIADIIGSVLVRPDTSSPSCMGAMIAAGIAMEVVSIKSSGYLYTPPSETYCPTTSVNRKI